MLNPFANDFKPTTPSIVIENSDSLPEPKIQHSTKNKPKKKPAEKKQPVKNESSKYRSVKTESSSKPPRKKEPNRRLKSSTQQESTTTNEFTTETKFIAIEAAIPPLHRIDPANSRRSSVVDTVNRKYEHGYERYIDWINRSLRVHDTVTVVAMDNAIVDLVSMVTILQDRKIAAHDDLETFTMNPGTGKFTSCIQVKLHPFF